MLHTFSIALVLVLSFAAINYSLTIGECRQGVQEACDVLNK